MKNQRNKIENSDKSDICDKYEKNQNKTINSENLNVFEKFKKITEEKHLNQLNKSK